MQGTCHLLLCQCLSSFSRASSRNPSSRSSDTKSAVINASESPAINTAKAAPLLPDLAVHEKRNVNTSKASCNQVSPALELRNTPALEKRLFLEFQPRCTHWHFCDQDVHAPAVRNSQMSVRLYLEPSTFDMPLLVPFCAAILWPYIIVLNSCKLVIEMYI